MIYLRIIVQSVVNLPALSAGIFHLWVALPTTHHWRALILWAAIITRLAAREREKEQN